MTEGAREAGGAANVMTMNATPELRTILLRHLQDVDLEYTARAQLVASDATIDWWVHGTLTLWPDVDGEDNDFAWVRADGVSLTAPTTNADDSVTLPVYDASGFTVDTFRVADLAGTLDARSADAAHFAPLVDPESGDLVEEVLDGFFALGAHLVVVDRVELAPAWRGSGGVGALLTATALRWLSLDAKAVAVHPHPFTLGEDPQAHPRFPEALASVRRTWASLGFQPLGGYDDIWVLDPGSSALGDAERRLRAELLGGDATF